MSDSAAKYKTRSAVLFIIFNRPDETRRVFERIKETQPERLYIAADGARFTKEGEQALCDQSRSIVNEIDWDCEVKTLFRDTNAGCKDAVSSAISWFFDNEEEGVILEDDCLPDNSFFKFCDVLLDKYRFDTRIRHVGGGNFQHGKKWGEASYYFSNITHVWGWASWRRVWREYDKNLSRYQNDEVKSQLEKIFSDPYVVQNWSKIFAEVKAGKVDTWDYQLGLTNFFNNGLSVIPNVNLISNIGFGLNATHTSDAANRNANIPLEQMNEISHPVYILPEKTADLYTFEFDFNIAYHRAVDQKNNLPRRRFKRWLRSKFKK